MFDWQTILLIALLVFWWALIGLVIARKFGSGAIIVMVAHNTKSIARLWIYLLVAVIFWPIQPWALMIIAKLDQKLFRL